jgi:hypothetical protein
VLGCQVPDPPGRLAARGREDCLDLYHTLGLGAFFSLNHFEFHFLPFFQALEAFTLDVAVVHEDIGAIVLGNKSVALGITEPFDFASNFHSCPPKISRQKIGGTTGKGSPYGTAYRPHFALDIYKLYKIFALCQIVASGKKKIFAGDGFHTGMARVVAFAPDGFGGSAWESNPPTPLFRRYTGFEVRGPHQ